MSCNAASLACKTPLCSKSLSNLLKLSKSKTLTMTEKESMINELAEEKEHAIEDNNDANKEGTLFAVASRKERRKMAKMEKRKKKRKEMAETVRRQEEARLNDPEEQLRLQAEEEQEKLRLERDRREFEEKERKIREESEKRKAHEEREEAERRRRSEEEEELQSARNQADVDEDGWEYVEEGPPEIIWQGNEIIVKKKKIRVKKKDVGQRIVKEDPNRPTSNPLPPQSEVFEDYKNASSLSAQELLENVAQETPNFGTEQDKAHCPFHLKTGACRFGSRCSRIHFYPDKSCTLLIKNMYNGPGLAWEQDEGLEYTDEEVERFYEEFYEDVHTEFLKFGEIVNFKVCRNGSSHLRGNVYVHYKSLDSAVLSYQSANLRYFAGKQLQCEFVGVTRWKVAICGEYMKSKLQACSRGVACNFIHCFRNPGGDYEWADWDKPPPRYWLKKMAALFGSSDELLYGKKIDRGSPRLLRNSRRALTDDANRPQSREADCSRSSRDRADEDVGTSETRCHRKISDKKHSEDLCEKQYGDSSNFRDLHRRETIDHDSARTQKDKFYHHGHSSRDTRRRVRSYRSDGSEKKSGSPDDLWEIGHARYDSNLTVDWGDGERQGAFNIHREESSRSGTSEEYEHKKLKRRKISSINGEVEHDSVSPCSSGRIHRDTESSSKYCSETDGSKLEQAEPKRHIYDQLKTSVRKRGKSRIQCHEAMRSIVKESERRRHTSRIQSHESTGSIATENRIEEATDERGRWEPDKGDISE